MNGKVDLGGKRLRKVLYNSPLLHLRSLLFIQITPMEHTTNATKVCSVALRENEKKKRNKSQRIHQKKQDDLKYNLGESLPCRIRLASVVICASCPHNICDRDDHDARHYPNPFACSMNVRTSYLLASPDVLLTSVRVCEKTPECKALLRGFGCVALCYSSLCPRWEGRK